MFKLSKKAIATISGVSVLVITSSVVLTSLALKTDKKQYFEKTNPLGRGNNYRHFSLSNRIMSSDKINSLIDKIEDKQLITYVINEKAFIANIKSIAQNALKSISIFSKTYLTYNFICNYRIKNTRSIDIDLVWFQTNSNVKYYDQFSLSLETI